MIKKHPPPSRKKLAERLSTRNTTGIAGVSCKLDPQGKPYAWIAQTRTGPGQAARKFFSVGRYGAAEAKLLATAERQKQLRQMTGLRRVHPAEPVLRAAPVRQRGPLPDPLDRAEIPRSTNTSGTHGVGLQRGANGQPLRWKAQTHVGDQRLIETFSIKVHGYEQARALAVAARSRHLEMRAQLRAAKSSARSHQ